MPDLPDRVRLVIFDLDGVVYRGTEAVPGAKLLEVVPALGGHLFAWWARGADPPQQGVAVLGADDRFGASVSLSRAPSVDASFAVWKTPLGARKAESRSRRRSLISPSQGFRAVGRVNV